MAEEVRTIPGQNSGEKSPILPKYYKADLTEESIVNNRPSSFRDNCYCCCFVVLVVLVILSVIIGLSWLGVYYGTRSTSLASSIKTNGLRQLLEELQATAVNDSRSVLNGYNNSAEYVFNKLTENGYEPQIQYFTVPVPEDNEGSFTVKVSIDGQDVVVEIAQYNQFEIMLYSAGCSIEGDNDCTWTLESLVGNEESEYGCAISSDLTGKAVLIPYETTIGNCSVYEKASGAKEAGATAVIFVSASTTNRVPRTIVFEREDDGSVSYVDILSVGINNATGNQLIEFLNVDDSLEVTLELLASVTIATTYNVYADTIDGREDRTIVFGSHLDSVPAGPGINDDGSGSMTNLEVAIQIAKLKLKPKNKVRFAWWGAEELGLLGSRYYVSQLNETDKSSISLYLNFDMIGSPNFVRGVYSAESAEDNELLAPLTKIQNIFIKYFNDSKKSYILVDFTGGSDYRPFLDAGIPAGGLFTGAGSTKTETEWQMFGGLRNVAHDPCYHQSCDTVNNINYEVYEEMSRSAAHALQTLMQQSDLENYLKT